MDLITKPLILQLKKIANFIALEGENKECYWFALILTIYALIGDFTRARRYANHSSGKKYAEDGSVRPQSPDALHCEKARSATVFKKVRDKAAYDEKYVTMRKEWRTNE